MREGLRFDPPRLEVPPGTDLIIELENVDSTHQPHNFLVVVPGTRARVVEAALALGAEGPALGFVPPLPEVLASSPLLEADQSAKLPVRLPGSRGIYPFVCTFPGHGAVMFGAMYCGVPMPPLREDTNVPAYAAMAGVPGGGKRPFVQRIFLPDCGPAGIAVALPGGQNYCWDAGLCRLRYVWQGDFIDGAEHWAGKGAAPAVLSGVPWWRGAPGENPARQAWPQMPSGTPRFLGYRTTPDGPHFRYRVGSTEVTETVTAQPGRDAVTLTVSTADGPRGSVNLAPRP